jgi:LysM repeat protein
MRIFILSLFLISSQAVFSQNAKFFVKKSSNDLYIEHKVQPKENWYSVGRIYFISPKEIAKYNATSMDKGLGIGQTLRIPLNATNFSQAPDAIKEGVPVYHSVQSKENLFRVVTGFGATVADIKKWNGLKSEQLNAGTDLVIGFLKSSVVAPVETLTSTAVISKEPVKPQEANVPINQATAIKPAAQASPVVDTKPKPAPVQKLTTEVQVKEPVPVSKPQEEKLGATGQFSSLFDQQSREGKQQKIENPVYGVFKSTSGWQDGKYYVLLNNVVPGTIVRILSKTTSKQLFAKVLGAVPAGKESEGMVMRMSNATQAALGLTEGNTGNVEVYWYN